MRGKRIRRETPDSLRFIRATGLSRPSQKIPLADLDAALAQDVVGGGGVEIEVRQREGDQVLRALQRQRLLRADGKRDLLLFRAVDLFGLEAVHVVDRLGNARLEVVE